VAVNEKSNEITAIPKLLELRVRPAKPVVEHLREVRATL
jgi:hypothetical protein